MIFRKSANPVDVTFLAIITTVLIVVALSLLEGIFTINATNRSAEESLASTPALFHGIARFVAPDYYVIPNLEPVGALLSVQVSMDNSFVHTTQGYFSVEGAISAIKHSPVNIAGLDQGRVTEKLCIGEGAESCYRLLDSRSL